MYLLIRYSIILLVFARYMYTLSFRKYMSLDYVFNHNMFGAVFKYLNEKLRYRSFSVHFCTCIGTVQQLTLTSIDFYTPT